MAVNLSIKGVPEAVAARLRRRAELNHRSLQGELMSIVESAAAEVLERSPLPGLSSGWRRGTKSIEQLVAERRGRFARPIAKGPLAVDIVRSDRDSR